MALQPYTQHIHTDPELPLAIAEAPVKLGGNSEKASGVMRRRYVRSKDTAPPFLLTERDVSILEDLWRYSLLTTGQIEILRQIDLREDRRFVSRLTLQRRLQKLFHHQYVNRIPRPIASGSMEPVYLLDSAGARELSTIHGDVKSRPPSRMPQPAALDHLLAVNQVEVCLEAAHSITADIELLEWLPGDRVAFTVCLTERGLKREKARFIPDGYAALRTASGRSFVYVEVDRATEPSKALARKARGYYEYWRSGGFADSFSVDPRAGFRVLFIAPSARRAESILLAAESLEAGQRMFWTTTQDQIRPDSIASLIFQEAGSRERPSLIG